nr:immunoglobulin light chain junction region [Homo sapiens]
DFATYYCQQSY